MLNNNQIILTTLLKCGYADLELLEDVDAEVLEEALDYFTEDMQNTEVDINTLIHYIFFSAIKIVGETITEELADHEIENVSVDVEYMLDRFSSFHNFIDTHASFKLDEKTYHTFESIGLIETIKEKFEELTDFNLEIIVEK